MTKQNNGLVCSTQSIPGGKIRLVRDKWITEIDARVPLTSAMAMIRAMGGGRACRVDISRTGARFRTLLPNTDVAAVIASATAYAVTGGGPNAAPATCMAS